MATTSDVQLRLPAESAYVAVLRMTTAGLAARLDFTLDDIEDLRIAVGEACALVLEAAQEGAGPDGSGALQADFGLSEGTIAVTVAVTSGSGAEPDKDSFGWQVLTALVDDLDARAGGGQCAVSFSMTSATASAAPSEASP